MSSNPRLSNSFCKDDDMFDMELDCNDNMFQTEKKNVDSKLCDQAGTEFVPQKKNLKYNATDYPMCNGLPSDHFSIIYADPPFEYSRKVGSGVANNHYLTMTDKELFQMDIPRICTKDSALFLWCSGPTMVRALHLMKMWGFEYKTVGFVWVKTSKNNAEKPVSIGLGRYTRPGTEFVLIGVRGKFSQRLDVKLRPEQVVLGPRGAHSAKPADVRDKIASMVPDEDCRCLELFSRIDTNDRWSVWGDQAGLLSEGAPPPQPPEEALPQTFKKRGGKPPQTPESRNFC